MKNNSVTALFSMLATSRSCGNIRCFDYNYQPANTTLQVSVLIIKHLVVVSFGLLDKVTYAVFLSFEKKYGCVVKGLVI